MPRRSLLFVPGNDERKLRKSTELGCDGVIIDLEDSVPPGEKERAREIVSRLVGELDWGRREVCVRINPLYTYDGVLDLARVARWDRVSCIVVPKAETDIGFIYRATGRTLIPIIESPRGFVRIEEVVGSEGVSAVTWGPADLALSVGGDLSVFENNIYLRTIVSLVASLYGVDAIDKVYFDIEDLEGFRRDAMEARRLGYVGKTVVHPRQIDIANEVFTPSSQEIEWARTVVEVFEEAARRGRGAVRVGDRLVDHVHYRIAKRILERASGSTE